ncbi:MAG: response regulator transcription factor [Thermoleophilia bacterium]
MSTDGRRVLVVEDDPSVARLLELELGDAGYAVRVAATGRAALEELAREEPDLMVLDVRLPDLDGLTVCRQARRDGHRMPVLMLTALDRVGDRVIGLDSGADDYLAKPFAVEELLARMRALQRRAGGEEWLECGDVRVNVDTREVTVRDRPVDLSAREFDLLVFLLQAAGRVFNREQIYEGVWGYNYPGPTKVIDVFISNLRKKLDAPGDQVIRTVRGVGYTARR